MRPILLASVAIAALGCSAGNPRARSGTKSPALYDRLPYATAEPSEDTRILLVAGGDDIANFAQEVVSQRALWKKAGFSDAEIACYYAKPASKAFAADRKQYRRLARRLRGCYAANAATVRAHLLRIAKQRPPFVYLYVTGHGTDSFLGIAGAPPKPSQCGTQPSIETQRERSLLDDYALGLNAAPGPTLGDVCGVLRGHRHGREAGDLMFSPVALREALAAFPDSTRKVVVLQACFSGGFVGRSDPIDETQLITSVPNLTALTATRHDRPSFGCSPGEAVSYFGGAYLEALDDHVRRGSTPATVDWRALYETVRAAIDALERAEGERSSHPQYFDNTREHVPR